MDAETLVTIYALVDEVGTVRYIGQTRNVTRRRKQHLQVRPHWTMKALVSVASDEADEAERQQIAAHRAAGCALTNVRAGGRGPGTEGRTGLWLTKEERERLATIARRENRKLAQQIRQFIYEGIERREREHGGERERSSHDLRAVR